MIIDLKAVSHQKEWIKGWIEINGTEDLDNALSMIALARSLHIVAVAYFLQDILGPSDELTSKINMLSQFYRVSEVKR